MAKHCYRDHDSIRTLIEERGGEPAVIRGTDSAQPAQLHITVSPTAPDITVIPWEEFFTRFDEEDLVLVHDDEIPRAEGVGDLEFVARDVADEYCPDLAGAPDSGDKEMLDDNTVPDEEPHEDEPEWKE